jgi:hypothetical protein
LFGTRSPSHAVLRHAARISDFREVALGEDAWSRATWALDGITTLDQVLTALKLCCWVDVVESTHFTEPFEHNEDHNEKFEYFLNELPRVLAHIDADAYRAKWQQLYDSITTGMQLLASTPGAVTSHRDTGLLVIRTPHPLHYHCLFSQGQGWCDTVLSMYQGQRYELEGRSVWNVGLFEGVLDAGQLAQKGP